METTKGIWLMTGEGSVTEAVTAALSDDPVAGPLDHCPTTLDLSLCLQRDPRPIVLVDIEPDSIQTLAELRPLIDRFVRTRFVVLADRRREDVVLEAMQAGARHYLTKDRIGTELRGVVSRFAGVSAAAIDAVGHSGAVITVLSAAGGCGATTIAVNLASELAALGNESGNGTGAGGAVLLMDLDARRGGIGAYLGLKGEYSVADVLARHEKIDPQIVRSTAVRGEDDLHVLLSPSSVNFAKPLPINDARLGDCVEACRNAYPWTIIDAPDASVDVAVKLAEASDATLIVMQLSVKDIRATGLMTTALIERGVPSDRICPVANRYERRGSHVPIEDARRALGGREPRCLGNDFRSAIEGVNYGVPLTRSARRSVLRRQLRDMAGEFQKTYSHSRGTLTTAGS